MKTESSTELAERILDWLEHYASTPGPASGPGDDALFLLLATLKSDLQYVSNMAKPPPPSRQRPGFSPLAVSR
ncbi:hypothetical protein [Gemmobacter sp. 24YEA27]|uniref:hypothetical protein n=1 Tax=Gemmobacter sp. 24YEA27 TaxID=3040672 RepID=UPI0024B3BC34|nr:hypothetical protein [Gemmobacter sp. 24YEA27]